MEYTENIFTKIIRKEVPARIVYEDEETLAFLDNSPNVLGHTQVIPKKSVINIFDVDDSTLAAVMRTVRKIAPAVRDAVGAAGVHINSNHGEAAGQVVPHLHFHIIPRHSRNEYEFWPSVEAPSAEITEEIFKKITSALESAP